MTSEQLNSVCPHDCTSGWALEVERHANGTVGRMRGAAQPYTDGVIRAKVARYAERVHNPARLTPPPRRVGPKGSGQSAPLSWHPEPVCYTTTNPHAQRVGETTQGHNCEPIRKKVLWGVAGGRVYR